ncbi:MAG: hypothetical protein KJO06_03465 [Gemmatimonadetes bacterium]|nr:hypothetical protein [Gemmatimonadota bacterium]
MWIRALATLFASAILVPGAVAQEIGGPDRETQVEQAVLAAPESMRSAAMVLGYGGGDRPGDPLSVLREGTNDLICLADDPAAEGFHVACYHSSLDDFMVLGRRLKAQGVGRSEIMDARYAALQAGDFTMPDRAALYSISADNWPFELDQARRLTVVYVPGATTEELGLPARPDGTAPWLMLPGTPWAHIMIGR